MRKLLSILICVAWILTSCTPAAHADNPDFTSFTDQLFIQQMNEDALSANYTLAHPENWGVTESTATLGTVTTEGLRASVAENENLLARLEQFRDSKLSFSQEILYNTLDVSLRHAMKDKNYLYYHQYLGPTTGVQAQLPVLLSEFHLNNKAQFNTYFSLLKSIPAYFQSIVDYEIAKTEHHLSASASSLTRIIEQCHEFAQNPEKMC